jgi:hypothetical protein
LKRQQETTVRSFHCARNILESVNNERVWVEMNEAMFNSYVKWVTSAQQHRVQQ